MSILVSFTKGGGAMLIDLIFAVCAIGTLFIEAVKYFESKKNNR